ncbi:MAG: hypothetical protein WKG01_16100 [Kofleriaceae bacterium]
MHERATQQDLRSPTKTTDQDHTAPGRQTLAQPEPAALGEVPQWETIGPEEAEAPESLAHLERAADSPAQGRAAAEPAAEADGPEPSAEPRAAAAAARSPIPDAGADAGAHDKPYERNAANKSAHFAKEDKYNRGGVKTDPMRSKYHVARPGIRVGGKRRGRDLFTLAKPTARRFTFVKVDGRNVAREFDTVTKSKLTVVNWKFDHKPEPKGKTRLLLNPAMPRKLQIDGKLKLCVFSWVGGSSAAWIPVSDLVMPGHSRAEILSAVRTSTKKSRPARAPGSAKKSQFVFRPKGDIGEADTRDRSLRLGPNHGQGGNDVSHYLGKTLGRNTLYPIAQTLPQDDAAVLACETAIAGDRFFVPEGKQFVREVGVFKRGATKTRRRQVWVYGFLGKVQNGKSVADPTRAGWVPLRTLMPAP